MMGFMFDHDFVNIDCNTCLATGTTACNDCVVGHVLANESGPINLVVTSRAAHHSDQDDVSRVIGLMSRAGMLDDPPVLLTADQFMASGSVATHPVR